MEVPEELRVAIDLAQRTVRVKGRVATFAREMEQLLVRLRTKLEAVSDAPVASRPARLGGDRLEYIVEGSGANETLAEHRTSGKSKPFRCPRSLYDAVANVLASAERPLSVEEIATAVEKLVGDRPAEFQLRVPLRFWMSMEPPLLIRSRARYRAADSAKFKVIADNAWASAN